MKETQEKQTFGARLRIARERTGLSQADFGHLGGVTKSSQYLYEGDHRLPDVNYLGRIRRHLDIDLNELVAGVADPRAPSANPLPIDTVMQAFVDFSAAESESMRLTDAGRFQLFQRLLLKASMP